MELVGALIGLALMVLAYIYSFFGGGSAASKAATPEWARFPDRFRTAQELQLGLRKAGLESSNLIVGVDFTKSNTWTGERSFGGRCLHALPETKAAPRNPYQRVLSIMGRVLSAFDDDNLIPAFGFGDANTRDRAVFPLGGGGRTLATYTAAHGFESVLADYEASVRSCELSGPTSFAPLIKKAIEIVERDGGYHILLIVADGQVSDPERTAAAIAQASQHPLSIVMVGVGDGPWGEMERYDDELPARVFDNFQFVRFDHLAHQEEQNEALDARFALDAMMEIPDQFAAIRKLGYLGRKPTGGGGAGGDGAIG